MTFSRFFGLLFLLANISPLGHAATPEKSVQSFNYIIGTQTFGPKYHFTGKTPLVETAEIIRDMGASVIKFELAPRALKGTHGGGVFNSLTKLARDEPSHRQVLDMPFAYFICWMSAFNHSDWRLGFSQAAQEKEYREVYEFVSYLLTTYSGSDKSFFLGHWEGDGMLRQTIERKDDERVTPEAVQGMIDWLSTRQHAVDAAKRDTTHERVNVWHYTEVNHVTPARDSGRPALVNKVLPHVAVDFVSYSAYDTTNFPQPDNIKSALDYIESKLTQKPGMTRKRVFIGEYGFPSGSVKKRTRTPAQQDSLSRIVIQAGLEWGCPFILYWELYNNELTPEGEQVGFWMIDDMGVKQPIFNTHTQFYQWAREYVAGHISDQGTPPPDLEFRRTAVDYLKRLQ